ncbi:hypothetical protein MRB53_011009 [Persea americana]|uniref:Uncharacterized protein n=1 Tax=Persea americana TaxID=3435 RepID=A0ACC2LTL6_PERAE|nr:hypothetical protein MRB53_011009 [Persea americana]
MGSRRERKRKTEEERDEFWSQRPDWLPEGWTMNVKVRNDGTTASIRDRYYYEPGTSHQFRSRKEVEKFIQIGEVPRYKPKPKTKKSNVVHRNSKPTPSSDMVLPPTLEFYSKHLPSFMSCGLERFSASVVLTVGFQVVAELINKQVLAKSFFRIGEEILLKMEESFSGESFQLCVNIIFNIWQLQ